MRIWQSDRCEIRVSLANNRWETRFETSAGEPQIEQHPTRSAATSYARGYMEQQSSRDTERSVRSSPWYDATVLDEVEIAVGEVQAAIDDIPDMDDVSDALLENE